MFWLRNKKIIFLLHTLHLRPDDGDDDNDDDLFC